MGTDGYLDTPGPLTILSVLDHAAGAVDLVMGASVDPA
jgi:hypothetical protein